MEEGRINMKNRFIPAFVMLTAGLICALFSIVKKWDITYSLVLLLFVLLIFYCIGKIAARIIAGMQAENLAQQKQRELEEEARAKAEEEKAQKEAENIEQEENKETQMNEG